MSNPSSASAFHDPLHTPNIPSSQWEPKYPFDLVIAYEDTTTRNRALSLYDHLAQQLLDDHDFQCSWWKFNLLDARLVMEQAADAAADANMIVVSLRAAAEVPASVRQWVESWVGRRGNHKSALVSIVAGNPPVSSGKVCPIQAYLHKVARQARMDFFAHRFDAPDHRSPLLRHNLAERATLITPLLEEILEHRSAFPRWGINE